MTNNQIKIKTLNHLAECQTYFEKSQEGLCADMVVIQGLLSGVAEAIVDTQNKENDDR